MRRLALVSAFLVLLAGACKNRETIATGSDVGARMPEYSATRLDGSKFDMAAKRDKVVLINIWATWCGPCRFEIPELQKLHDDYAAKGLEVVGVSVDDNGVEPVKEFVGAQKKMTYPIAIDPEGRIATLLQTSMLPTSVLVDRDGVIVWKHAGPVATDDAQLMAALEKAL